MTTVGTQRRLRKTRKIEEERREVPLDGSLSLDRKNRRQALGGNQMLRKKSPTGRFTWLGRTRRRVGPQTPWPTSTVAPAEKRGGCVGPRIRYVHVRAIIGQRRWSTGATGLTEVPLHSAQVSWQGAKAFWYLS